MQPDDPRPFEERMRPFEQGARVYEALALLSEARTILYEVGLELLKDSERRAAEPAPLPPNAVPFRGRPR